MDKESASWCPLAKTLMHTGGEVLRKFLQLEILTMIFTNYSRFWMKNVHNPAKINYLAILCNSLVGILNRSQNPSVKILNELLESWTKMCDNENTVMEQIERLKQWKNDIEKERKKSLSSSIDAILTSWLSQMEQEIQKLIPIRNVTSQWNNTFHVLLQNAQISLLLEIEKNDRYLSSCSQKLKSLSKPSIREFQEPVQTFRKELVSWKTRYHKVLEEFCNECRTSISKWLREAQDVPQSYAMVKFLKRFQNEIDECDLQAHIDLFCDKWDDDLHNLFNRYEKQIHGAVSVEVILNVAQGLSKELEISSFKEKKIRDFFSSFNPPEFPRLLNIEHSKLKSISKTTDLNNFDLSVLVAIWKKGDFVHSPLQDRDEDPHDWDTSISADILRVRKQRNSIINHIEQDRITSNTFETIRKELKMLLEKIASGCGGKFNVDICREFDPQREYELRKEFLTWCINDILIQLSAGSTESPKCIDMLQSIQKTLEKLSNSRRAFMCRSCNKDFSTDSELVRHIEDHMAFTCRSCNKGFSTNGDLVGHIETHKALTCRRCNMYFATNSEVYQHLMLHRAFRCCCCNQYFDTNEGLLEHFRTHPAMECPRCQQYFTSKDDLAVHIKDHEAIKCPRCQQYFTSKDDLAVHIRFHEELNNTCTCS